MRFLSSLFLFLLLPQLQTHAIISVISMQALGFTTWDLMSQTLVAWWFNELLIVYLTVPLLLSILAYRKVYYQNQEKIEMGLTLVGMLLFP